MFKFIVKNFSAKIILTILILSTLTIVLPENFQPIKIVYANPGTNVNITYRLLAVEDQFDGSWMWSGEYFIQNLTRFNNWRNGTTTVGDTTYNFKSYIHLLSHYIADGYSQRPPASHNNWTLVGEPSNASITNEIKNFLAATGPGENNSLTIRIFYYIGHTGQDPTGKPIYYLSGLGPNNNETITASALNELLNYGDLAKNNCTLIILDTCYAGKMIGNLTRTGRVILAGDNASQSSVWGYGSYPWDYIYQWGAFSGHENPKYYNNTDQQWHFFGKPVGIVGSMLNSSLDTNKDGWLSAGEIFNLAKNTTAEFVKKVWSLDQNPSNYYGVFGGGIPLVQYNSSTAFPYNTVLIPFFKLPKNSWSRYRGSAAGTGYSFDDPELSPLWEKTLNFPVNASPTVADGLVFVGNLGSSSSTFYALDMRTGDVIWSSPTLAPGASVSTTAVVSDGLVFFGAGPRVYALDEGTGFIRWSYLVLTGAGVSSSPLVLDGKVIFGADDGYVRALDEFTGSWLWDYPTGAAVISSPSGISGLAVYVGSMNGRVYALNINNGQKIWDFDTLSSGVVSSPAVADGRVFVGSLGGIQQPTVFALNSGGTLNWSRTVPAPIRSSPAVDAIQKILVIGAENGFVYAYNSTTGNGPLWASPTSGPIGMSSPAISGDNRVFIGSQDDSIYCLSETSGSLLDNYPTGGYVSSPAIVEGHIYASSMDGKIYAFGPPFSYNNLAVSNVSISSTNVTIGQIVNLTATIMNLGNVSETFDVEFGYWNRPYTDPSTAITGPTPPENPPIHIASSTVVGLNPGSNANVTVQWNTSTSPPPDTYYIFAEAKAVIGEIYAQDNVNVSSPMMISQPPVMLNITYRLLAVETWFGSYFYMWSGEDLIQNLTRFNNWNNGSTTVGSTTYNFRSYIHLLTENQRTTGPWTYAGNSSKDNIINEIKNFLAATGPGENNSLTIRIFYYIGHSSIETLPNETRYYLSNLGPNKDQKFYIAAKDGGGNTLNETLCYGDLATNNCTLVILDTCYAGKAVGNLTRYGRVILAGDNSTEQAVYGWTYYPPKTTLQWGWFTGNENAYNQTKVGSTYSWTQWGPMGIIGGLFNGDDTNKDGWRSAGEVFTFANTSTTNYAAHNNDTGYSNGWSQHPSAYYGVFGGGIPLVQYNSSAAFPYNSALFAFFKPPKNPWWRWRGSAAGTGYTPIDPENSPLWEKTLNFPVNASPTVADGLVFIGDRGLSTSTFYALDMRTGDVVWAFSVGNSTSSTAATSDGLVFFSAGPRVYALDEGTGFIRWSYNIPYSYPGASVSSSPLVLDGKVIFGADDGYVRALDEFTGSPLWGYLTGGPVTSSPSGISGLAVYVGSMDGRVYALNINNGQLLWDFDTLSSGVVSSPAVADGRVFVGSLGGMIFALNSGGTLNWSRTVPAPIRSSPAVDAIQKILVIGAENGFVYAYNSTTGNGPLWASPTSGPIGMSSPAISGDNRVFIGSQDDSIYCLNETSGLPIWDYVTGGDVYSPAVVDDHIYASSIDSKVYAFGPPFPIHNLRMWNVSVTPNATIIGGTINITAIVINDGNVNETFNVDFGFWNNTYFEPTGPNGSVVTAPIHITTLTVTNLLPGENITLNAYWNTTTNPPENTGTYYVFAEAQPTIFEEFNVADNIAPSSPISISGWPRVYWYSAGFDSINVVKYQGWRDIKNMSIAVNFAGPANLTAILSMNIISQAGGEIRLVINSTAAGFVNGTRQTVSVLGTQFGEFYYDMVMTNYTEAVAAGWYNVTFQWRSLGALASNWMMNDPTGSPGYLHRAMHVAAQNPSYMNVDAAGTTDTNVAKYQGWQPIAHLNATVNLASSHNVTVAYSIRLVSSALVQPSGEVRLMINGTGVGWVNGSQRVDPVYKQLGDYDCVLGNYTALLPAGTYIIQVQWRALGLASDWIVNQPIAWTDLMHRELHIAVNPP